MKYNVLLVDDHAIMIDGLKSLLQERTDLNIGAANASPEFALSLLKCEHFDLIITDYSMPGINGLEFIRKAKAIAPQLRIIMLSMHDEPFIVQAVIKAGVDAYILKKYARQELFHAIDAVLADRQYWSREVTAALINARNLNGTQDTELTNRETDVLKLLAQELTSKQIADKLFISERTVETHRKNLLRKTNSANTIGLIKYAFKHRLI